MAQPDSNPLMMRHLIFFLCLTLSFLSVWGQDRLVMMDGTTQAVWLVEVNERTILYKAVGDRKGPTLEMPTQTVKLIRFSSGGTHSLQPWGETQEKSTRPDPAHQKALYWDMGSLGLGYLAGSFQYRTHPRIVWEIGAGYVGVGQDPNQHREIEYFRKEHLYVDGENIEVTYHHRSTYEPYTGAFIRGGPRLFFNPKHVWHGFYLYPQVFASQLGRSRSYTYLNDSPLEWDHEDDQDYIEDSRFTYVGATLNLGYQHLFLRRLSLDIYTGLGYAYRHVESTRFDLLQNIEYPSLTSSSSDFQYHHFPQSSHRTGGAYSAVFVIQMGWLF